MVAGHETEQSRLVACLVWFGLDLAAQGTDRVKLIPEGLYASFGSCSWLLDGLSKLSAW